MRLHFICNCTNALQMYLLSYVESASWSRYGGVSSLEGCPEPSIPCSSTSAFSRGWPGRSLSYSSKDLSCTDQTAYKERHWSWADVPNSGPSRSTGQRDSIYQSLVRHNYEDLHGVEWTFLAALQVIFKYSCALEGDTMYIGTAQKKNYFSMYEYVATNC